MQILIAEDDPISRRVLQAMLGKWGYDVTIAEDGREALRQMQQAVAPRLVILDWMMPRMDGVQVCREIRGQPREAYTYVIMLTTRNRKEDLIAGLEAGADDYLTKPFDCNELKVRLRSAQRLLDLQDQLIAAREALREQATHDALTGLLNRAAILSLLNQELARSARQQTPLGLLMADLDKFKKLNDTYGHKAGDDVLVETAKRMKSALRNYDGIGRYGGEEFLVVLPNCGADEAAVLAERIRQRVSSDPIILADQEMRITISLGVTCFHGDQAPRTEQLIGEADMQMYRAKRSGGNSVSAAGQAVQPIGTMSSYPSE